MNAILFDAVDGALRLTSLRDRLRCPDCRAVGTYKPHGGIFDTDDVRKVRRWLCKFCGYYNGPEGVMRAEYSRQKRCWTLPDQNTLTYLDHFLQTPLHILWRANYQGWPWRG